MGSILQVFIDTKARMKESTIVSQTINVTSISRKSRILRSVISIHRDTKTVSEQKPKMIVNVSGYCAA
jgi:hypothetical protein